MEMEVLPLHKHKDLTDACAEILNSFWPRSQAARNHSLSQSCDHLPVSLAFVRRHNSEVLGFSKISAVQGIEKACLVESVIVRQVDRGKGLGRVLMNLTEEYAQKLGVKTVYLNTLDQEGFYSRIGYIKCKPVVSLGANAHRVPEAMLQKLLGTSAPSSANSQSLKGNETTSTATRSKVAENINDNSTTSALQCSAISNGQPAPGALPPPPPPPPPPPTAGTSPSTSLSTYSRAVVRMDPNSVTWMKKDLF